MFEFIYSSVYLIIFVSDSLCQTVDPQENTTLTSRHDLCGLTDIPNDTISVFSVGNHIYYTSGENAFPLNADTGQSEQNLTIQDLFPGLRLTTLVTVILFNGPLPCNQANGSCPHLADNLVLALGREGIATDFLFQAFRYYPFNQSVMTVSAESEMPWNWTTYGRFSDLSLGSSAVKSGFYLSSAKTVFLVEEVSNNETIILSKPLDSEGNFETGLSLRPRQPVPYDYIFVDHKERIFSFSQSESHFRQVLITGSGSTLDVNITEDKHTIREFFGCEVNSPLLERQETTIATDPQTTANTTLETYTAHSSQKPTKAADSGSFWIIIIIIIIVISLISCLIIFYIFFYNKKETQYSEVYSLASKGSPEAVPKDGRNVKANNLKKEANKKVIPRKKIEKPVQKKVAVGQSPKLRRRSDEVLTFRSEI